ncbi:tetratricopeptide repeat protein [Sphaerotilus microaerophilus]|uniref:Methyltransferase type 11 domain-containing protein n=1 Tax=Sphaerotilus microaerophilus TaxID=2914710 RepID=A0ABN6PNX4_9BURK|nr:tetratricopeptide repeat protein [Sphaerotilus sp. FB-5]BDI04856.1 hypothetical protein CATMQ487_18260 [Sphaerotilus sp. FB-5]
MSEQALAEAVRLLRSEQLPAAEAALTALLAAEPAQPDALHYLGVLRHIQGRSLEGIRLIRQALEQAPGAAGIWNNLGNILLECGELEEAAQAYQRSLAQDAAQPQAHNNLATLHRRQGRWAEAEGACLQALQADPGLPDAWYNLSLILLGQGRVREGLEANSRAILLWPRQLLAREQVLRALIVLGQLDEAARLYRDWLAEEPDNPVVQHQYAACLQGLAAQGVPQPQGDASGPPAPSRASDAYVETLFDHFAASFDAKLGQLHYRAPERVATAVREALGEPPGQAAAKLNVADLGCGTGLCGPLIRPWAARLAGCDLSVGMLRQAKARGVYDLLHKAELVYYLDTQPGQFDLLVCADTLCYFGDLQPVLAAARRALRPGGYFVFTVERLGFDNATGWQLQPNGRYAHTLAYLETGAAQAGLRLHAARADTLRQEAGQPVSGWVVTLAQPGK